MSVQALRRPTRHSCAHAAHWDSPGEFGRLLKVSPKSAGPIRGANCRDIFFPSPSRRPLLLDFADRITLVEYPVPPKKRFSNLPLGRHPPSHFAHHLHLLPGQALPPVHVVYCTICPSLRTTGTLISEPRLSTPCEMRFFPREPFSLSRVGKIASRRG